MRIHARLADLQYRTALLIALSSNQEIYDLSQIQSSWFNRNADGIEIYPKYRLQYDYRSINRTMMGLKFVIGVGDRLISNTVNRTMVELNSGEED